MNVVPSDFVAQPRSVAERAAEAGEGNPRILFLIRSFGRGGAQRQLVTLATALRRSGWDVSAACFYAGDAFQRELEEAGVPVIDLRKHGRRGGSDSRRGFCPA